MSTLPLNDLGYLFTIIYLRLPIHDYLFMIIYLRLPIYDYLFTITCLRLPIHDYLFLGGRVPDNLQKLSCNWLFQVPGLRLVSGVKLWEGRIEVNYFKKWGTICDDGFTLRNGNVLCRSLGYGTAKEILLGAQYGQGMGKVSSKFLLYCRTPYVSLKRNVYVINYVRQGRARAILFSCCGLGLLWPLSGKF